jgi:hypothetical protein
MRDTVLERRMARMPRKLLVTILFLAILFSGTMAILYSIHSPEFI